MRHFERVLIVVLAAALGSYALDCLGTTTPEQAMQCCKTMRCMSHHHQGQECCKTMPTMRAALDKPVSVNTSVTLIAVGTVQLLSESLGDSPSERFINDQSHAPPIFSPPILQPLRI